MISSTALCLVMMIIPLGMLYGVFDGHGGSSVADILVKEMPRKLLFQ